MRSVGDAALKMVMEVRRQFKEIPGLMEGTAKPDYNRCIAISTQAALHEMILPGLLPLHCQLLFVMHLGKASSWRIACRCNCCWCIACTYDGKWWWRMG